MNFKIKPQPYRPGASFLTLLEKEILRFKKIALQTIFAPVLMGLLYLLVFGQVLAGKMPTFDGVNYLHFLVPGLVMMTMLQNAFGNSSSSMLSSKIMGSLIFIQLPPFAGWELSLAMIGASIVRALIAVQVFCLLRSFGLPRRWTTFSGFWSLGLWAPLLWGLWASSADYGQISLIRSELFKVLLFCR